MLHRTSARLLIAGAGVLLLMIAAGIMTVSAKPPSQEGEPPNLGAEYAGSGSCTMCHTEAEAWHASGHAQMVRPVSEDSILGDLSDTAAVTITWPDGSERPITANDITYVLGGRYMQQYVSVMNRPDGTTGYFVLPVQWNIPQNENQTGTWTLYHAEDWQEPSRDWRTACAGCHTTGLAGATAADQTSFAFVDNWSKGQIELNIGCEACHGPGANHFGKPGVMVVSPDAQVCGQCHIQGTDPSGEHGYPVGYQPGLPLDESVFVPAPPSDESVWWADGHARVYNQYGEWMNSAHARTRVMGAVCAQCHGTAPDVEGWTLDDIADGVTCAACHDAHTSGLRIPITAQQTPGAPTEAAPATEEPTQAPAEEEEEVPTEAVTEEAAPVEEEEEAPTEAAPEEAAPTQAPTATTAPSGPAFSWGGTATSTPTENPGFSWEVQSAPQPTEKPAATATPAPTNRPAPTDTPAPTLTPTASGPAFSWSGTATLPPTENPGFSWGDQGASGGGLQRIVAIPAAVGPMIELVQRQDMPLEYTLCVACHNSHISEGEPLILGGGLHHPTQEMFEGWSLVDAVPGIASAHYSAESGPLCTTCHMPDTVQIGEFGRVSSHTMQPVLPSSAIDPDTCSTCHNTLVTRPALQQFIDNTQTGTQSRIDAIKQAADAPDWVKVALSLIEGDGSLGVHNPAYTDALLDAAELEVGIQPAAVAATPSTEELGLQPVVEMEAEEKTETNVAEGGLKTPSIILLAICGVIIAAAAYAFFVREAGHE